MSLVSELFNTIMNNPLEAFVLLLGIVFLYKFFLSNDYMARENRNDFKLWLKYLPSDSYYFLKKCISNQYSYCNLQHQKFEQVLELIAMGKTHNWHKRDFIKAKLRISSDELTRIIHALQNLGIIEINSEHQIVICSKQSVPQQTVSN